VFHRVLALILLHTAKPVDRRDCDTTRADCLHCLETLRRVRAVPWHDGTVEPAIRLVENEAAWKLIWSLTEIRRHAKAGVCDCTPAAMDALTQAIEREYAALDKTAPTP
jgi:hypothetical protein